MIEEAVGYEVDGTSFISTIYRKDRNSTGPGMLVFPDIVGIGDHSRERARWLAEIGYIVIAVDLHGNGSPLEVPAALAELERFYADPTVTLRRAAAATAALHRQPGVDPEKTGAIGFCYGGTLALEMVRTGAPLRAIVGFHSVLTSSVSWDAADVAGKKMLICVGAEDPQIPEDQRHAFEIEMQQTEADWQLHLYGGVYHSFTDWRADHAGVPDMARYNAVADRRSWRAATALFEEAFG